MYGHSYENLAWSQRSPPSTRHYSSKTRSLDTSKLALSRSGLHLAESQRTHSGQSEARWTCDGTYSGLHQWLRWAAVGHLGQGGSAITASTQRAGNRKRPITMTFSGWQQECDEQRRQNLAFVHGPLGPTSLRFQDIMLQLVALRSSGFGSVWIRLARQGLAALEIRSMGEIHLLTMASFYVLDCGEASSDSRLSFCGGLG